MTMGTSIRDSLFSRPVVRSAGRGRNVVEDGTWIGRVDRGVRRTLPALDRRLRRVLEMRQRLVVWVGDQPLVDEAFDDPAAPERATQIRPPTLALEVLPELGIVRVALEAARDLCLDVGVGDRHALRVRDG